ncbi:uncharacterized protein [Nicotiana sylvestris]|uniref:uncharacterized protein n=1 Tax=Nicotiana sylvestris TaxID=4096 RepID=UPI00388CC334
MASDFMDRFRFNTENAPDVFYIQNLKKKPTETFHEYATRWRSEAAKVRPSLEDEQMNKCFVRAQDPQYYERQMLIESHEFSDIIKLGERIEEGIKIAIAEPIDQLYERLKAAGYITPIHAVTPASPSQWVNPNKSCAYHSGMKGHTIDECRSLKDKIQALIDNKIIVAKEPAPNVRNNLLLDHKGGGVHMIEIEDDWDPEGSIGLITEGDDPKKPIVTLNLIMVQIQPSGDAGVNMAVPLEFETTSSAKTPAPIEVEFVSPANAPIPFEVAVLPPKEHAPFGVMIATLISVVISTMTLFHTKAIPWDYTAEAKRKGKVRFEETVSAQGPDDLWRKIQAKKYSVIDQLNKTPSQIFILALLQNSEAHKNALVKVLSEAYVPNNIIGGERANMVGQVLESHKITFHEDELPPEGLGHNKALHITVQCEDYFITKILIDGGSSLNICPLVTLKKLGKGLHEIKDEAINVKAFDGSQRSTIEEISLCLQMGPTCITITYLDQSMTVMCNETTQQTNTDSEEDEIPEELFKEVENFENRPKSNLDKTKVVNLGDAENIWMDEEDAEKMTFITPWGIYCYKMMTFILKNAGDTYMRVMTTIFHDMIHKEIEVKAIQELPPPKNKKDVMSFLGRHNCISRFIAQSTVIYEPIVKMLKKDAATKWTDDCQKAFNRIKDYLSTPPILVPLEPGRPLLLYLAVLDGPFGCVLGQHDETWRKEQTIYYLKITGQALAGHLAENPVDGEYKPLKMYFPDEEVSFIGEDIAESYDG